MLIEKLLVHFRTKEEFDRRKEDIQKDSIVFIKNSKHIHTHGRVYKTVHWTVLDDTVVPSGYRLVGVANASGGYNHVQNNNNSLIGILE